MVDLCTAGGVDERPSRDAGGRSEQGNLSGYKELDTHVNRQTDR